MTSYHLPRRHWRPFRLLPVAGVDPTYRGDVRMCRWEPACRLKAVDKAIPCLAHLTPPSPRTWVAHLPPCPAHPLTP